PMSLELGRERAVASALKQGRIEVWNPWSGSGVPLWAEQGGPFFPTKLIYYLCPHDATFTAALTTRLVVAALGMFYLALALGISPLIAGFIGALFEYSGALAAELPFANASATYMLPWALLGAHKVYTKPGRGSIGFASVALGIASLGGHPSLIIVVYLGFSAWLLGEWAHTQPRLNEVKRLAHSVVAVGAIALLIAAAGLL